MQPLYAVWLIVSFWNAGLNGQAAVQAPMPPLPLPQLDDRAFAPELDSHRFSLTFGQPVPIRDLLLLLVRGTSLSIVADPSLNGSFIGELKNVSVRQALDMALPPLGLDYSVDGALVRVFPTALVTRFFDINYLAIARSGATTVGGSEAGAGLARVETMTSNDFFSELEGGARMLLSDRGLLHVDRKAGVLQVSDVPDRLDRVAAYLETVHERAHRQVQIDARIVEVELSDPSAQSLDWSSLAAAGGIGPAASLSAVPGLRVKDTSRFLAALSSQGRVSLLASPKVLALNNELAVVRARSESASDGTESRTGHAITLGVVSQIAADGLVMLSISPIVSLAEAGAGRSVESVVRETDTLARVAAGETVVVSGFARARVERRGGGLFRRATTVTHRVELLVLLTPTVVDPQETH